MSKIKVMIVDDSSFFRTTIRHMLEESGCEVVGETESFENLIETYKNTTPDLVLMDIAMPGKDGFECSRALLINYPSAKIVLLSSMKDEETEAEARKSGVVGYIQKPVDEVHLMKVINNILSPDVLYEKLNTWGTEVFKESLLQNIARMTKRTASLREKIHIEKNVSQGISAVTGIIGKYSGIVITDISEDTAKKMAQIILKREAKDQDEILSMVAEFANIVSGVATSMLNKNEKMFGFRVAPPSLFYGDYTEIVNPSVKMHRILAETEFGNINLSFGFKEESVLWM